MLKDWKLNIIHFFKNKNNFLFIFSAIIFVLWSVKVISTRVPFVDEVNAWNIAGNCGFFDLFRVTKHEGHPMLWFLVLKPFAIHNIGYPYTLFLVNWLFAFGSFILLWLYSPFNPYLKMIISFSMPFQMYTVYARCYALTMFLLFVICIIYPKRLKHPVYYAILIVLLANTSVIGIIPAFVLGLLFLYEINKAYNNKIYSPKDFICPFSIMLLGGIFVLSQLTGFVIPSYADSQYALNIAFSHFNKYYSFWCRDITRSLQIVLLVLGVIFFTKDKKPYIYIISAITIFLFIALKIYPFDKWHYTFVTVYIISSIWIYLSENKIETSLQKIYLTTLAIMTLSTIYYLGPNWMWNGYYMPTYNYIKDNISDFENSNIFMFPSCSSIMGIIPSLDKHDIRFYNSHGLSYKDSKAYEEMWNKMNIKFKNVEKVITNNKRNKSYILVSIAEPYETSNEYFIKASKNYNSSNLEFKLYTTLPGVVIYKIITAPEKKQ